MNENCCRKQNRKNIPLACEAARARAGELNSVSEYLYLSIMFADALPELSEYWSHLAMEEMHHHRALGELILRLGGDPAERSCVRNSGKIDLCQDCDSRAPVAATRALKNNILDERRAAENYSRLAGIAERCGDLSAASLFKKLSADEARHAKEQEGMLS
jgi:rubrerythrin